MKGKINLTRPEPLLVGDRALPTANNELTSRAVFLQRKKYEKTAFASPFLSPDNKPIDLWYEKPLYGRISPNGRIIHARESKLRQIPNTSDLFAFDFVVDAYVNFAKRWQSLKGRQALEEDSEYYDLEPVSAWVDLNTIYHRVMTTLYQRFFAYATGRQEREKRIRNFDTFMNVFLSFVDSTTPLLPFTRTAAVLSSLNSPATSGLIIQFKRDNHAEDKPKVEKFIRDPNFPIFKEEAMRHGFLVDSHAPWRLVADLASPAMAPYMRARETNLEAIFKDYYFDSQILDLDALKVYVMQFYNSFARNKPRTTIPKLKIVDGDVSVCNEAITRSLISETEFKARYSEYYWLRFYTYVRAREKNLDWDQYRFEKITRNANKFRTGVDKAAAMRYVDKQTSSSSLSARKNRNFHFINTLDVL